MAKKLVHGSDHTLDDRLRAKGVQKGKVDDRRGLPVPLRVKPSRKLKSPLKVKSNTGSQKTQPSAQLHRISKGVEMTPNQMLKSSNKGSLFNKYTKKTKK